MAMFTLIIFVKYNKVWRHVINSTGHQNTCTCVSSVVANGADGWKKRGNNEPDKEDWLCSVAAKEDTLQN